jgi:beta-fructofuranosidase
VFVNISSPSGVPAVTIFPVIRYGGRKTGCRKNVATDYPLPNFTNAVYNHPEQRQHMYTGNSFNKWGIGDVDVIKADGIYHLFHLVLPNHSYIAHAVSSDGLHWERVKNALFISDPGRFDDSMLWTMHVSRDPDRPGSYRMFYTGLTSGEQGRIQRVGLAESDDLYTWRKIDRDCYPIAATGPHYESSLNEGRHWVSFRDPFFYQDETRRWLLAAGRVKHGPVVHRGCVVLVEEVERNRFLFREPLYFPARYDDIEVPSLVKISDKYYLIGSIREDIKVHYWWADCPEGPYRNFSDNVLLPKGNYAARICRDGDRVLIWNFFSPLNMVKGENNMLPPPKELIVDAKHELQLKSFYGFDKMFLEHIGWEKLTPIHPLMGNASASLSVDSLGARVGSYSGMEVFCLNGVYEDYRLRGELTLENTGKCGWAFHLDDQASGYYVSIDPFKGLAQIRAWGERPNGGIEDAFIHEILQATYFVPKTDWPITFELLAFGKYIELSIGGYIVISLADEHYQRGRVGFYTEGGHIHINNITIETLESPKYEECDPVTQAAGVL